MKTSSLKNLLLNVKETIRIIQELEEEYSKELSNEYSKAKLLKGRIKIHTQKRKLIDLMGRLRSFNKGVITEVSYIVKSKSKTDRFITEFLNEPSDEDIHLYFKILESFKGIKYEILEIKRRDTVTKYIPL